MTAADRCPSCGASVLRDDVGWCVQCYASLAPEAEVDPEPEVDPETPGRPPAGDGTGAVGSGPEDVEQLADRMLAELAQAEQVPQRRWLRGRVDRRTMMLWTVAGGAAAFVVLIAVLAVVGRLL